MGKSKKPKVEVTEYYMSEHFGICAGQLDALLNVIIKEKEAWSGAQSAQGSFAINLPQLFGGVKKEGGVRGLVTYLPGASDQVLPDALAQKLGRANGADCPGFRGITSLFFTGTETSGLSAIAQAWAEAFGKLLPSQKGFYWSANTPYLPGVWAKVRRILKRSDGSEQWYPEKAAIYRGAFGSFVGLSWKLPSTGFVGSYNCNCADFDSSTYTVSGDPSQIYSVTFRIRGVVELTSYAGGDSPGPSYVRRNATPPSNSYNLYSLTVSSPANTYYLNNGNQSTTTCEALDYELTINAYGGAVITLFADSRGGQELRNAQELEVPDDDNLKPIIVSQPYVGQFMQLDAYTDSAADMNAAHIIRECLTDTNWGMGAPIAALDDTAFREAADTLYGEGFGLSMLWTRQASIQDFVQEVLDHIQGVLFVDPSTGLLTLKLIRADYDEGTLPVLTPDNADLTSFSRKLWGDIVNEITVTWTNPENEQEETITVQADAEMAIQGGPVPDSRNYYGVRNSSLAQALAYRDLRSAGQPLASCEVEIDRTQWRLRPASVVKVTWPEYGLSELVMRATEIDYGRPGDPSIKAKLIEDVYGLDIGSYDEPPSSDWVDPSAPPAPLETVEIFTLPLFFAADTTVSDFVDSPEYPEVLAGILATTESEDTFSYQLWDEVTLANGSLEWQSLGTNNIIGRGELVDPLALEATSTGVTFDNITGQTSPTVAGFVIIGDDGESGNEIAMVDAVGSDYTLIRGVLDTVPRVWPVGTPCWFVDGETLFEDSLVRSAGETADYKLLTQTSQGLLALADAPLESYTLTERPWLPNRPANVTAYGEAWSSETAIIDAVARPDPWVTVTWANRNRLTEDSQVLSWTDSTVTPETGQTTTIEVRAVDGTLLTTHDGLSGTSYNVPDASFGSEILVRLRVFAERSDDDGDFVSLQYFEHWVQVAPLKADSTVVTADSIDWTADEGL